MNYDRGFKRITILISIIAFIITCLISSVYFYRETRKNLSHNLEFLEMERSLLEEKEKEVSEQLKERNSVRLIDLDLIDLYKRQISIREKQIPPKSHVHNLILALSISLAIFISIWIIYFIFRITLIIIIKVIKWLILGFADN